MSLEDFKKAMVRAILAEEQLRRQQPHVSEETQKLPELPKISQVRRYEYHIL